LSSKDHKFVRVVEVSLVKFVEFVGLESWIMVNILIIKEIIESEAIDNDKDNLDFGLEPCCGIALRKRVEIASIMELELGHVEGVKYSIKAENGEYGGT